MIKILVMATFLISNAQILYGMQPKLNWPYAETPYEVLGIEQNTTAEEINKAYKKLALKSHPDKLVPIIEKKFKEEGIDTTKNPGKKELEDEVSKVTEQFKKINAAHDLLSDQKNRQLYDQSKVQKLPRVTIIYAITHKEMSYFTSILHQFDVSESFKLFDYIYLVQNFFTKYAPNLDTSDSWLLIHFAAAFGYPQMVEQLMAIKPSLVNEKTKLGLTPLKLAILFKNYDTLQYLLNHNKELINLQESDGETALMFAARYGDEK